ncbi:hypothetical protein [Burkholderia territorii]|uniref:hypothetical protein n=1 Tax=Burkholderia territorii TaxID=1503055 RepID=UPI00075F027E|nr:hypothetical protein WT98_30400 [Burkholderia territorii]
MTKRTTWPMRIDADAQTVGTARVRDSWAVGRSSAAREIARKTGVQPPSEFDDIAGGFDPGAPVPLSMQKPRPSTPVNTDTKTRMQALGRLKTGEMNQTEKRYAEHLEGLKQAGEIAWYRFEGIKFRLADNTFYTPDFAVMLADGRLEAHEVKGHWQDDARVKIKVAADQYPIRFIAVTAKTKKAGGGWQMEEF